MNAAQGAPGTPVWQRGFYEHVIRNEAEQAAIREYILANPARWDEDENNPAPANGQVWQRRVRSLRNKISTTCGNA